MAEVTFTPEEIATFPQGPQGIQGLPGLDGVDGAQGAVGPTGADGSQGPPGSNGAMGPQGLAGAAGPQGPQGIAGGNGHRIDPQSYGADPTGVALSGAAINAAITAAGSYGWVDFGKGGFNCSDQPIDLSTFSGVHLSGSTASRGNPSATGGGTVLFSTAPGTKIVKAEPTALNHYGPFLENLRIEDRAGTSTCLSVKLFNNVTLRSVTFHGNGQSTGLVWDGTGGDASYWQVLGCAFHHCVTGLTTAGSVGGSVRDNYFESQSLNHVLASFLGAAFLQVSGNKFESSSAVGSSAIQVGPSVGAISICQNGFEQCVTGVNLQSPATLAYTGALVQVNQFTGGGANGCTGVIVGANRQRDVVGPNRYSNMATNYVDNGTDTIIHDTRIDGLRLKQHTSIGGVYFGEGTVAPPAISVPIGSQYVQSGVGMFLMKSTGWVML